MVGLLDFDIPPHPLDVKPSGNAYTATHQALSPFALLPDEIIVHILEFLDPKALTWLGATCRHLRAFSRFDELWKTHCVVSPPQPLKWRGNWYATFTGRDVSNVPCSGVFSDTLYRPFLCAHTPLEPYAASVPERNQISRLADLNEEDFLENWTDLPFILTEPVKAWPIFQQWTEQALMQNHGQMPFRAECVDWPMSMYVEYMNNTADESPLYLFDRAFVEKMALSTDESSPKRDYWTPACFGQDFFQVLGDQRPDYRWLIIGPERSGSTFHKDPNGTSAWNAVITGSKYWIMFPSGSSLPPPPGVYASADQSEVTTPTSIAEWLLGFHAEARKLPGCIEGVCRAGEILHVPSGWWHLVVNLEPSIAVTQNFVPKAHLPKVLAFLRDQKSAISGFRDTVPDAYELFVACLRDQHPAELEEALEAAAVRKSKKRIWEEVTQGTDEQGESGTTSGFTFGFGADEGSDYDDEVP